MTVEDGTMTQHPDLKVRTHNFKVCTTEEAQLTPRDFVHHAGGIWAGLGESDVAGSRMSKYVSDWYVIALFHRYLLPNVSRNYVLFFRITTLRCDLSAPISRHGNLLTFLILLFLFRLDCSVLSMSICYDRPRSCISTMAWRSCIASGTLIIFYVLSSY